MRPVRRLLALLAPVLLVIACGEADPRASFDAATDGAAPADSATIDDGAVDSGPDDGGPLDGGDDAGEVSPIALSIRVIDADGAAAPSISVSVVGEEAEAVTDDEGWVEVEIPGPGVVQLRFAGAEVITTLIAAEVTEEAEDPSTVQLFPSNTFDFLEGVLGASLNRSLGLVLARFRPAVDGGQSAAVQSGGAYVYDEGGAPVPGNTLLPGGQPDVLFVDVPVGAMAFGYATPNGGESCSVSPSDIPEGGWVGEGGAMTIMVVDCHLVP
jgi:hypothetical protein